jgi:hypothetical protein
MADIDFSEKYAASIFRDEMYRVRENLGSTRKLKGGWSRDLRRVDIKKCNSYLSKTTFNLHGND